MARLLKIGRTREEPSLPDGIRVYAVTDIHGRADLLETLLGVIDTDVIRNPVARSIEVYLGDYIDRGPASREVLDLLIERSTRRETVFLKGNHEEFFLDILHSPTKFKDWRQFGLLETLRSYGVHSPLVPDPAKQASIVRELHNVLPREHLHFLQNLKLSFSCGDFFFVHAGVRPGVPLQEQQAADLLWIRNEFLDSRRDFGKYIVHGHTPVHAPDIRPNRINIDTGAYATGNLTLLTIEGSRLLPL